MATQHPNVTLGSQTHDVTVFQQLENYAWDADPEFQSGLQAILNSNPSAEQSEHLILRARCFYFARKKNAPIEFNAYQTWRSQQSSSRDNGAPVRNSASSPSSAIQSPPMLESTPRNGVDTTSEAAAPHPSYFGQIIEIIASGEPIPGIKEVPDTVMEGQASQSTTAKRKKPWEKDGAGASEDFSGTTNSSLNSA